MLRSASSSTLSSQQSTQSRQSSPHVQVKRVAPRRTPVRLAICLPMARISNELSWVLLKGSHHDLEVDTVVCAGTLVQYPLNKGTKPAGINAFPLYLNARHFSGVFPVLRDQVRAALTFTLTNNRVQRQAVPSATLHHAMVTSFFPQLVRNMSVQLALSSTSSPTLTDLEVFTQVHLLWRTAMQRFGQDAQDWIAAKIQAHVANLSLGGVHARQVPLLELVTLLHVGDIVNAGKKGAGWSWAKLAHRIVEENTIRLFHYMQYVRRCDKCAQTLVGDGPGTLGEKAIGFANKLEALKLDGKRFEHWSVLRFHVQFLKALRSAPRLPGGVFDFYQAGGYYFRDSQHLEPGQLARLMHEQVAAQAGTDSWSGVLVGMGAAPMEEQDLGKWLSWCAEQGNCAHRSVHKCPTCVKS